MGVFDYIAAKMERGSPSVVSAPAFGATAPPGLQPRSMRLGYGLSQEAYQFVKAYRSTTFSCINRRAGGIASIPRIPQRRIDSNTVQDLPPNHWLPRMLQQPTVLRHITPSMIWKWMEIWHCGTGESYIITPTGRDPLTGFEVPIGMYPVPASSMTPHLGPDGFIESYDFLGADYQFHTYPAYQVCYLLNPSPAYDVTSMYTRGKGLVEAAISDIQADESIKQYISTSLRSLLPPYFIKAPSFTPEQKQALREDLEDWAKAGSATPMGFMGEGWSIESVDPLKGTKEGQLLGLPYRQSICEALDVPIGFFDTKQLNGKATVETLLYMFRVFTLEARMQEILEALNQHFQQFERGVELSFTPTDRRDSEAERLEDQFLVSNGLATPNMVARRRSLPQVPAEQGGDSYFMQSTLVPVQQLLTGGTNDVPTESQPV
ncbi:MAG: phage portal protein [Chlorobi bacterium]|nr:phage portal protein [Chlorobiota bacterium]